MVHARSLNVHGHGFAQQGIQSVRAADLDGKGFAQKVASGSDESKPAEWAVALSLGWSAAEPQEIGD